MERLGAQFYPNDATFPAAFLALRLEQAAAGLWPSAAERAAAGDRPVRALLLACRMSSPAVQRAYESLLGRRAPGIEDDALLVSPSLRAQLLRSLLALCQLAGGGEAGAAAAEGLGLAPVYSSQRRALAALADACDRWVPAAAAAAPCAVQRWASSREGRSCCQQGAADADALRTPRGPALPRPQVRARVAAAGHARGRGAGAGVRGGEAAAVEGKSCFGSGGHKFTLQHASGGRRQGGGGGDHAFAGIVI